MGRFAEFHLILLFGLGIALGVAPKASGELQSSSGSPFHKLRSISGAAGHEDKGRFIMDDARSAFTSGKDTKVIVYFEWEGPLGPHHFEGLWKSPEGKIVLISDFKYEAKTPHFSGYWTMLLADSTASGEWSVEARIDGEAAGFHSFIVTGTPVAASSAQPPTPEPLSAAEMYKTAINATVVIEKIGPGGDAVAKSTGFWIGNGQILTSFGTIDGAHSLRLHLSDGTQRDTDKVLVWSRWQDWAILSVPGAAGLRIKRGPKEPVGVGDRCVFLEWIPAGAKLTDGSITGRNSFQKAGERLLVASGATPESMGGALLNEYGEYVGLIGEDAAPGSTSLRILSLLNAVGGKVDITGLETTALAVPLSLLPDVRDRQPVTLAEIEAKGEFLPPVTRSRLVATASLSSYVAKDSVSPMIARDYREIFSRKDQKGSIYVSWMAPKKQKVMCEIRLFNLDNKLLVSSKPKELSLNPEKFMATTWEIPVGNMLPGIYRIDLALDSQVVWREFFRVTE